MSEGPVLVLNVFSRYPGRVRRGPVVIDHGRYAEEASAARFLGFESDCLNEVDAALRDAIYEHPANLFRPPIQRDLRRLPDLSARISDYLAGIRYECLYLPLGIGWHVDHVLCHLATESFRKNGRVLYYEDAPYCLVPHLTHYRLRELAALDRLDCGPVLRSKRFSSEWHEASRHYAAMAPLKKIRPWPLRVGAAAVVSVYLWRLLSRHRRLWLPEDGSCKERLEPEVKNIAEHFLRKIDACHEYKSQIQEFFIDRDACESSYRSYSAAINSSLKNRSFDGSICERFWQFGPTSIER